MSTSTPNSRFEEIVACIARIEENLGLDPITDEEIDHYRHHHFGNSLATQLVNEGLEGGSLATPNVIPHGYKDNINDADGDSDRAMTLADLVK